MLRCACVTWVTLTGCGDHGRSVGDCDGPCPISKIDHLVIVLQENHNFDNYFARYCTAPAGSQPTCTSGAGCCEAGPATDPSGAVPIVLDDATNGAYDPDHSRDCELQEANGSAMDRYATGTPCSDPRNIAYADASTARPYWELADRGGLADRYFQPVAGASSANDMYLVRAQFVFDDNTVSPGAIGSQCSIIPPATTRAFPGPTIGHLLDDAGVSWAYYLEGYQAAVDADATTGRCPRAPADCPFGLGIYPCVHEPADIPITYYDDFRDNPRVMRDYAKLATALSESELPQVTIVRGLGYHSEHPGSSVTISEGTAFVHHVIDAVENSAYAGDTLVLVTWDEGGGYFDHVAPPPDGVDGQPYGTRVPLIAIGPFVRAGTISHITLEHSSIVKLIEWNWLGGATGQLAGRDATIANLGSLLDPETTGTPVPD
jgi:phospholipase C